MRNPFWSFTQRKAILTQNIQTTFFIQITYIIKVSKHKSIFIQLTFNQNQFYRINSTKINFFHRTTKHTLREDHAKLLKALDATCTITYSNQINNGTHNTPRLPTPH
jgi:hypothetical protein